MAVYLTNAKGQQVRDRTRDLAAHVLAHRGGHPDAMHRAWYSALYRNLRYWPAQREFRESRTPHEDALAYAQAHDGTYCEGLLWLDGHSTPVRAIWAHIPASENAPEGRVVCFTHAPSAQDAIQGLSFDPGSIYALRWGFDVRGPYLFSNDPIVLTRFTHAPKPKLVSMN